MENKLWPLTTITKLNRPKVVKCGFWRYTIQILQCYADSVTMEVDNEESEKDAVTDKVVLSDSGK